MAYQKVFKRYEIKYMLTREQKDRVVKAIEPYMMMDNFGRSTIRNIYFDTDDYILARHSIAKPDFKEKLRIRSYSRVTHDDTVFVELKRKFDHVVYKRRISLAESDAMSWTTMRCSGSKTDNGYTQIPDEINYFLDYYRNLRPAVFLSYDREAYRMRDKNDEFRLTFDENVLCRDYDMSLTAEVGGTHVLEPGKVLMELKCPGGIPLWMVEILNEEKLYKTSFSKYGTVYTNLIYPALAGEAQRLQESAEAERGLAMPKRQTASELREASKSPAQAKRHSHSKRHAPKMPERLASMLRSMHRSPVQA